MGQNKIPFFPPYLSYLRKHFWIYNSNCSWSLGTQMLCEQIAQLKPTHKQSCQMNGSAALSFDKLFIHNKRPVPNVVLTLQYMRRNA